MSKAEETIQAIFSKMESAEVDRLAPDEGEFRQIAQAIMAWYQMLLSANILRSRTKAVQEVLASSLFVLGSLVKYTYALGRRRGRRDNAKRVKRGE